MIRLTFHGKFQTSKMVLFFLSVCSYLTFAAIRVERHFFLDKRFDVCIMERRVGPRRRYGRRGGGQLYTSHLNVFHSLDELLSFIMTLLGILIAVCFTSQCNKEGFSMKKGGLSTTVGMKLSVFGRESHYLKGEHINAEPFVFISWINCRWIS